MPSEPLPSHAPGQADADPVDERAGMQRLLRVMSLFVLWPAATALLALLVADPGSHGRGMIAYFLAATALGLAGYVLAPRLSRRFAPESLK